jgi:hypothetical protein
MVEIMCIVGEVEKTHILRLREDDVWDHSYHEFFLEKKYIFDHPTFVSVWF